MPLLFETVVSYIRFVISSVQFFVKEAKTSSLYDRCKGNRWHNDPAYLHIFRDATTETNRNSGKAALILSRSLKANSTRRLR